MSTALLPNSNRPAADGSPPRVIVIGGGLAGMAAAVALQSAGLAVTLLECRRLLGGRASSFDDPQTNQMLDAAQHVLLGCCTNLRDFYQRLGVSHLIRFERAIHFRDSAGRQHSIQALPGLPAPFHLAASLATFSPLSLRDRFAIVRAMLVILRLPRAARLQLADLSFGQWLQAHRQPPATLELFYSPILIGALNESPARVSAATAIQVFQDAMLAHKAGYLLGIATCSLATLYQRLPCSDVRLGARVTRIQLRDDLIQSVQLHTGEALTADAYVLATNRHAALKLLPEEARCRDARFAHLDRYEDVPILSAHLRFDRPVLAETHAALLAGPLQWIFRKDRQGCVLLGVISAAREWVGRSHAECLQLFEQQIRSTLPAARSARLEHGRILIEKRATFSPQPGLDRYRPSQAPPSPGLSNLFLAGDYTQTHWPATMEGAVRSGYLAADAVLQSLRLIFPSGRSFLVRDLPRQWPARLFASRP